MGKSNRGEEIMMNLDNKDVGKSKGMSVTKAQERLLNLHKVATLEVKRLIELMGAEQFGKFAILALFNWLGDDTITLKEVTQIIQEFPKYFMLAAKTYVEGLGDEKANEMFKVKYNDIITDEGLDESV